MLTYLRFGGQGLTHYFTYNRVLSSKIFSPVVKTTYNSLLAQVVMSFKINFKRINALDYRV